jgi:hypothetical protein
MTFALTARATEDLICPVLMTFSFTENLAPDVIQSKESRHSYVNQIDIHSDNTVLLDQT